MLRALLKTGTSETTDAVGLQIERGLPDQLKKLKEDRLAIVEKLLSYSSSTHFNLVASFQATRLKCVDEEYEKA
jgi:predicted RNA-binding protein with PIN domain